MLLLPGMTQTYVWPDDAQVHSALRSQPALLLTQRTSRHALLSLSSMSAELPAVLPAVLRSTFNTFQAPAGGGFSDRLLAVFAHFLFEPGVRLVLIAAGCILCAGVTLTTVNTALFFVNRALGTGFRAVLDFWPVPHPVQLTRVKLQLGYTASVALQLLVAADVLDTLVKPSHNFSIEELIKLGLIVGVRTVIAFFLNKEVEDCEHELEKCEEGNVTI